MSEEQPIRKVGVTLAVTEQQLANAREDFIAYMGMTPEEFHPYIANALAEAFDRLVEEGK